MNEKQKADLEAVVAQINKQDQAAWERLSAEQRAAAEAALQEKQRREAVERRQVSGGDAATRVMREFNANLRGRAPRLLEVGSGQGMRTFAPELPSGGFSGKFTITFRWGDDEKVTVEKPGPIPPGAGSSFMPETPIVLASASFDEADDSWLTDQIIEWYRSIAHEFPPIS